MIGLFQTITAKTRIACYLPINRRFVSPKVKSYLGLGQILFQQGGNLMTFFSAEVAIGHRASSTGRSREPRAYRNLSCLNRLQEVALRS